MLQKKCVWQVTTIIQPALRHLGTSHFLKVLYNKIPMGQIRWPIFLFFMYMLVLSEKMSIFPKSNMFWILVFSCPKMTLITIFTRMTPQLTYLIEKRDVSNTGPQLSSAIENRDMSNTGPQSTSTIETRDRSNTGPQLTSAIITCDVSNTGPQLTF